MEKRGRQIFSKILRASKLTRQRTLAINNPHLDRSRRWQHFQEATTHGELTETRDWVFCQSFIVKPFWKYTNIQVLMTLKARKTSWCLNSVIYCEVAYCSWLFVRSKLCLPIQRKTRSLCHCFVFRDFLARPVLPEVNLRRKEEGKYFRKLYVPAS